MNEFKVILQSTDFNVKVHPKEEIKILPIPGGIQVPAKLQDLVDVDIKDNDKKDKYVLMYNAEENEYRLVNPDEVLSASSNTETSQPGLPNDFVNTLDVDLDNKIDIDGGEF